MSDSKSLCSMCTETSSQRCGGCRSSMYCSRECQLADWPTHKLLCKTFKDFTSRPAENCQRAIAFPVDSKKPRFIWLPFEWIIDDDDESRFQSPKLGTLLGDDKPFTPTKSITFDPVLNRALEHTINIKYRDTFLIDGSLPNTSVIEVVGSVPAHDWRGPILFYGMKGLDMDPSFCDDLDMSDFRYIVDYLVSYNNDALGDIQLFRGKKIKGVRINCEGDQKAFNAPQFQAVEVPVMHPVFRYDSSSSPIAKRIGIAILVRKLPRDRAWSAHQGASDNQSATFLQLNCDPSQEFDMQTGTLGWGFAPMKWQNEVGSVIVVREDRKPLLPQHMAALCEFCQFKVGPLYEAASKDDVLKQISKEGFKAYFNKWRAEQEQPLWRTAISPYEVEVDG